MHQTDAGGLDQLPRFLDVLFGDSDNVRRRGVVVPVEHR